MRSLVHAVVVAALWGGIAMGAGGVSAAPIGNAAADGLGLAAGRQGADLLTPARHHRHYRHYRRHHCCYYRRHHYRRHHYRRYYYYYPRYRYCHWYRHHHHYHYHCHY
jgi:hypothetical protein